MIGLRRYVDARLDDLIRTLTAQHESDRLTIIAAREDVDERLAGMNEFRQALAQQTGTFVPRSEVEGQWTRINERLTQSTREHEQFVKRPEHDALADRLGAIDARLTRAEGTDSGVAHRQASLRQTIIVSTAVIGIMVTMVIALLDYILR